MLLGRSVIKIFTRGKSKIGVLGIPFQHGQVLKGVEEGPSAIRRGGLIQRIEDSIENADVKDYGDVNYTIDSSISDFQGVKQFPMVASCCKEISKKVEEIMRDNRLCINLGGDHSIALGSILGHLNAKKDVAVIWVDAHTDINIPETSPSGNAHGVPLSLLCKETLKYWPKLPGMEWFRSNLSAKNLAFIGTRAADTYERLLIEMLDIPTFSMKDIDRYGVDAMTELALERVDPEGTRSIHVSYDIDSLSPLEAPCTGTKVPGGLTLREGLRILEIISQTGRLSCIDMVEVNPTLHTEKDCQITLDAAIELLVAACGPSRFGTKIPKGRKMPPPHPDRIKQSKN